MKDDKQELPKNNKDDSDSIAQKSSLQELYESSESTMASLAKKTDENNISSTLSVIPNILFQGAYNRFPKTDTPPKNRDSKKIKRGVAIGTLAVCRALTDEFPKHV